MAEFDCTHVLQLGSPLFWIRVDPFAWATVTQQLEREGCLLLNEAAPLQNYAE